MDSQTPRRRSPTTDRIDWDKPAAVIIDRRFSGLAHFCKLTGFATSTANAWRYSGFIPARLRNGDPCQSHILAVAAKHKIEIDPADFVEKPRPRRVRRRPQSPGALDSAAAPPTPPGTEPPRTCETADGQ